MYNQEAYDLHMKVGYNCYCDDDLCIHNLKRERGFYWCGKNIGQDEYCSIYTSSELP